MTGEPSTADHLHRLLAATWDPDGTELPGPIPWAAVATLAQSSRVGPLLHAAIQQSGGGVPEQVRRDLRQIYLHTAAANVRRYAELERILEALAPLDTPLLLLKGAALAETLYDNIALRAMVDLDLAVPPEQVPACGEALIELGYRPTEVEMAPGTHLAYRGQQAFARQEPTPSYVEVHWHLLDVPYYMHAAPMAWFWQNSRTAQIAGHPVQVLKPEADLVYLAAHLAFHHRFHGLRWFVDLALLVHRSQGTLDWEKIMTAARRFELLLAVRETLDRLAAYWPSLPLDEARARLHSLQATPTERRLFHFLTAEPRRPLLDFYTDVVCLPDVPARVRFVWRNLFPQRAYMAKRYGMKRAWQLPYWYVYRLGDGLIKMGRTLPQVLRLR